MGDIIQTSIIGEVEQSYLDYSMSVISDRAIPSAEDGLKPSGRRILWDMFDMGLTNDKKFVKCAQVVGDTMGRFHPHGDLSVYDTLCKLSQPWMMRYPLIEFHGNNGSRDGDSPAAYRYTECRLSKIGEMMLEGIKKNTVDWQLAYTDDENEPIYLPGLIPHLAINGTSGIAVAMACSFAPHNLNEIMDASCYLLSNPDCEVSDLLTFIKGPDFPTGGLVINKSELATAYSTGKGRARVRGEYVIESERGKDSIIFTSIPYKVSKEQLAEDIDKLCEENKITGIVSIRDESNIEGVRFVIELAKGVSAEPVIAKLFKYSALETTYSYNQVALINKEPHLINLKQLLEVNLQHQKDVLLRKCNFELQKIQDRINVLEGLLIALEDIENVIDLIRSSESSAAAKASLIAKYKLNENQAKAILDMKLAKLAKLEKIDLETEKTELLGQEANLNAIIHNPIPKMISILTNIKDTFGDARRTTITQVASTPEEKEIEFVEPEKCVVILTEGGLVKRVPSTSFKVQKRNGKGIKTQNDITQSIIRTNTVDSLMIFSNQGRMYRLLVNDIPEGTNSSIGQSVRSLVSMAPDEEASVIYSIYRDTEAKYVLFVTKNGLVKKTPLDEYIKTKKKTGIAAIALKENDALTAVSLVKDEDIVLVTAKGMSIRFAANDVAPTSRIACGVKGITMVEDDSIVAALPVRNKSDNLAIFSKKGLSKKFSLSELPVQKRAGKGLLCYKPTDVTGEVSTAALVDDADTILISGDKSSICIAAAEIPALSRASAGNQVIKGNLILSISKV